MSRFASSTSRIIDRPKQLCLINGRITHGASCISHNATHGLAPSQAIISLPYAMAGSDTSFLTDALVEVYADDVRDPDGGAPFFRGYVAPHKAQEDASRSTVHVLARDIRSILDRVNVGQFQLRAVVEYRKTDRITGAPTDITIAAILEDLFSSAQFPPEWKNRIDLGDLSGLATAAAANIQLPDIIFAGDSYLAALHRLFSLAPKLGIRLRHGPTKDYFDIYTHGGQRGAFPVEIPTAYRGPEDGAIATADVIEGDIEEIHSRVIGYSRATETMLTVGTDHTTAPLVPAWVLTDQFQYPDTLPAWDPDTADAAEAELEVIENPKLAVPGDPSYNPAYADIFRRFRLPDCLRAQVILARNLLELDYSDNLRQFLPVQFFRRKIVFDPVIPIPGETIGTESETDFEEIHGAQITPDGHVVFSEPVLAEFGYQYDTLTGLMTAIVRPVHIYVTLSVMEVARPTISYDTGVRGDVRVPGISAVGLVYTYQNNNIRYQRAGAPAGDLSGEDGAKFDAIWYNKRTDTWDTADGDNPLIINDDTPYLQPLSEQILTERNRRRTAATVNLPCFRALYNIGDAIYVTGRNIDRKKLTIHSLSRNLENPETIITASDQVPWDQTITQSPVPANAQHAIDMSRAASMGSTSNYLAPSGEAAQVARNVDNSINAGIRDGGGNFSPLAAYAKSLELAPSNYAAGNIPAPNNTPTQTIDPTMGYQ